MYAEKVKAKNPCPPNFREITIDEDLSVVYDRKTLRGYEFREWDNRQIVVYNHTSGLETKEWPCWFVVRDYKSKE